MIILIVYAIGAIIALFACMFFAHHPSVREVLEDDVRNFIIATILVVILWPFVSIVLVAVGVYCFFGTLVPPAWKE